MHCVVKHGNYAKAAEELGLSPSGVSRVISRLEERLNARLLQRTTRKLSLTEAGHEFAKRTAQILAELSEAETEMAGLSSSPRGKLRIAASATLSQALVRPLLAQFARRFGDLSLELRVGDGGADWVAEGFDIAFETGTPADKSKGLVSRRICADRRILVAAPKYLDARGEPREVAELAHHQCIVQTEAGAAVTWSLHGPEGVTAVSVRGRFIANDLTAASIAAAQGLGIAMTPTMAAGPLLLSGDLVRVLPQFESEPTLVYARYPKSRRYSPKVLAVVDFFASQIEDPPVWDRNLAARRLPHEAQA
jgi:DNA-binding transcriptional LysR family regulator